MPGASSLKSYLVSLGYSVDKNSYDTATGMVKSFEKTCVRMGKSFTNTAVKGTTAFASGLTSISAGITKYISGIAYADLSTERWAQRMYTTEESARSLLTALDAMGASFDDIFYMTPEEYRNLQELRSLNTVLQSPTGTQDFLRQIRDIGQEFNKTKVIISNFGQWVVYYLGQYMGGGFGSLQAKIEALNNYLIEKLPIWSEKVAKLFYYVYRLSVTAIEAITKLKDVFTELFDKLPASAQTGVKAVGFFLAAFKMGPIGLFIAGLLTLLLLLDDFNTWQKGGKSAYPQLWENISKAMDKLPNDKIDTLSGSVKDLFGAFGDLGESIGGAFKALWDFIGGSETVLNFFNGLLKILEKIVGYFSDVIDAALLFTGNYDKIAEGHKIKEWAAPLADENGNVSAETALYASVKGHVSKSFGEEAGDNAGNFAVGAAKGAKKTAEALLYSHPIGLAYLAASKQAAVKSTTGDKTSAKSETKNDNRTVNQTNNITVNGVRDATSAVNNMMDGLMSIPIFK